jgi:N-sulfoglucosamine sulfohydrolase
MLIRGEQFLVSIIKLFFCFYFFPVLSKAQSSKKPNIVLIVADDHGTDALGCYGNRIIKTPSLDRLAAEGVRFTNAFCTTASCSPSRAVLLSGLQNHANGMYGLEHTYHHFNSFNDIKSLPVLLADSGYRTARIGKYHLAPESVYKFQTVLSEGLANDPNTLGRSPVEMAKKCSSLIHNKETPFFLYYASDDPHRSNGVLLNGLPTFNSYPDPNLFGNRKQSYPGIKEVKYLTQQVLVPDFLPDNRATRAEIAQYYQAVSRLDQGAGTLIQLLKDADQYDNTLIIYLSDNGVAFPGAKTTLYDPGMKLPLIVKEPAGKHKNQVRDALISWVDITPTVLDYAGVDAKPYNLHGQSFRKVLEGEKELGQPQIFASHSLHEITMYYPMRAIRNKQYKLIYNIANELTFPLALDLVESSAWQSVTTTGSKVFGKRSINTFLHRPKFELYDIQKDPGEINNLANQKRYQPVFDDLLKKLKQFQKDTKDPWFHKWSYE